MKLILILLLSLNCYSQDLLIPNDYVGTWRNNTGTDTIIITEQSISWSSNVNETHISFVDYVQHSDTGYFTFYSRETVFVLSLEKISRIKIVFNAQTLEGLNRRNDVYFKQVRQ